MRILGPKREEVTGGCRKSHNAKSDQIKDNEMGGARGIHRRMRGRNPLG
jgi:hypothetical protein